MSVMIYKLYQYLYNSKQIKKSVHHQSLYMPVRHMLHGQVSALSCSTLTCEGQVSLSISAHRQNLPFPSNTLQIIMMGIHANIKQQSSPWH